MGQNEREIGHGNQHNNPTNSLLGQVHRAKNDLARHFKGMVRAKLTSEMNS